MTGTERTLPAEEITHFAPSEKAERQQNVMCGYVGPNDRISRDPKACTCRECLDWIEAPSTATGAGVTGQDCGLTKREYFAANALAAYIYNGYPREVAAQLAVQSADLLLQELAK